MNTLLVKKIISRFLSMVLPHVVVMWKNFQVLAFKQGQWSSIRSRMAVDAKGNPIPWYTYPAIEYLGSFDFTQCDVFEFGAGNSSLYWASRCKRVVSVDDNPAWYRILDNAKCDNQTLIHHSGEQEYIDALGQQSGSFDIIIIDGAYRLRCAHEALKKIKPDGLILLDNSDRHEEIECGKLLRDNGYIQIDFSGFGPINRYCWTTSVFLKSFKQFATKFSGPKPIGGLLD